MKKLLFVLLIITNCYACGQDEKTPDLFYNGKKFDYVMLDGVTAKVDISSPENLSLTKYQPFELFIIFDINTRKEIESNYSYFLSPSDFLTGYYFN